MKIRCNWINSRQGRQSVDDLRLMFFEQVAIETPEVAVELFRRGDAGKPLINLIASREWMGRYGVSADWLETLLRDALDEGQTQFDWFETRAPYDLLVSASAGAWLRSLATRKARQEILRMAVRAAPGRITYRDLKEDKRRVSRQCCWLVSWLFAGMDDERIANAAGVDTRSIVGRTRRSFAKTIGLNPTFQRGRRDGGKVVT